MRMRIMVLGMVLLGAARLGWGEGVEVVRGGKSEFVIVVGAKASASVRRGAGEVQRYLKEMSGAELPIVGDEGKLGAHAILVGRSRFTEAMGLAGEMKGLGEEGFVLRTHGGHVLVLGSEVRGAMYGCTALLEKMGMRWFTPRVTRAPRRVDIELGELDERSVPDFEYRETYIAESFDRDWAARLRTNGQSAQLDESTGGKVRYEHFVHTFDELIPPGEFAGHPEYFPVINGKRTGGYVQRCLSNPEVLKLMTEKVKGWMAAAPGATIFSVSQNDANKFCECEQCKAIEARYGGKHSGIYLWFVNQIAESIEKEHPDKLIDTLAYMFTEEPPVGIVPRGNVRVRLCPIGACEAHPYETDKDSKTIAFVANLKGWAKLTDTLYIWHYNTDFGHYLMPFPDFGQFPDSIRLYKRSGVKGIFFEGASSPGSADAEMKSYVMAHLLWDSRGDADGLVNEWMGGVYGPAAGPMRKWFDLLHERVKGPERHLHIFERPVNYFLTPEVLAAGDRLFDEAEGLCGRDEMARYYVGKARMGLRYVELVRKPEGKAFEAFKGDLVKYGITHISERQGVGEWEKAFGERMAGR